MLNLGHLNNRYFYVFVNLIGWRELRAIALNFKVSKLQETSLCIFCRRNSRPEVFYKKGVFKNFAKFTGNTVSF